MTLCHGQGTTDPGGCCYVGGSVCPHHLGVADLPSFIAGLGVEGEALQRATDMAQGVHHACGIALRLLTLNGSLVEDRAALNVAWDTDPDYLRDVRPAWKQVEQAQGLSAGSYQCSTWGPASSACCFSEDAVTNATKAAALSDVAVTVRRAGGSL